MPILSGGREITGWKPGEGKRWVADVPAARGGAWRFTQLFINGTLYSVPGTSSGQSVTVGGIPITAGVLNTIRVVASPTAAVRSVLQGGA